jgi:23S rRNA (pseudouridine1915-N3)-methyltransferase
MNVEIWFTGKTKEPWAAVAVEAYVKKCRRFGPVTLQIISDSPHKTAEAIRTDETARILVQLKKKSMLTVLLDETGTRMGSKQFANFLADRQNAGHHAIRFIIGGAYGVERSLHDEVDLVLSLSPMTFPHQLVRVIFLEQLYRAFTILRGEGYHH